MDIKLAIKLIKEVRSWMAEGVNPDMFINEIEAIDTVVAELDYLSKYSEGLQKTVIPHIDKIERLIKKQQRTPQDMSWFIAEASSIVGKAYYRGFGNGFDEGIKFDKKRKDANKDRKQG